MGKLNTFPNVTKISDNTTSHPFPGLFDAQCSKPSVDNNCIQLNGTTCFGSELPYTATAFDLVTDSSSIKEAKEKLILWSGKTSYFIYYF